MNFVGVEPHHPEPFFCRTHAHDRPIVDDTHSDSIPPITPEGFKASPQLVRPYPSNISEHPPSPPLLQHQKKRWTISLFFCFIIPITAIAAIYFSLTWFTVHRSAVLSLNDVTGQLHHLALLHTETVISSVLKTMDVLSRTMQQRVTPESDVEAIKLLLCQLMFIHDDIDRLYYGRMDNGATVVTRRNEDGGFSLGERPPNLLGSNELLNLTLRPANVSGYTSTVIDSSRPYDVHTRPWFSVGAASKQITLTPPYPHTSDGSLAVALSIPLFNSSGGLFAVVGVEYLLSAITSELFATRFALHTKGTLLLLSGADTILASSPEGVTFPASELRRISTMPIAQNMDTVEPVVHQDIIAGMGACFVLQDAFVDDLYGLRIQGIDWRLAILIPKQEYFNTLDAQQRSQIGLILGCLFSFIIVVGILLFLTVRAPLRRLRTNLVALREMVAKLAPLDTVMVPSRFSEIDALHDAIVKLSHAAQDGVQQRFQELSAAAELRKTQEESDRLMRAKDLFFAMMSHEMRTPLTACIGMAEVLLGTPLNDQQKECVDGIATSGTSLLYLINDILDFSKIESDKLEVDHTPFSIRECIEQASQVVQLKADEKNLELVVWIDSSLPERSMGDSGRLRQVLFNLLSNAVKFTNEGHVLLSCRVAQDRQSVGFAVEDSGIGIPSEKLGNLFKPFQQVDNGATTRKYGGTGLGLVISQKIVEKLGGSLEVQSEGEGRGCTFTFTLPLIRSGTEDNLPALNRPQPGSPGPSSPCGAASPSAGRQLFPSTGASVLVVDPLDIRRQANVELLTALGYAAHQCANVNGFASGKLPEPAGSAGVVMMQWQDYLLMRRSTLSFVTPKTPNTIQNVQHFIFVTRVKQCVTTSSEESSVFVTKPVTRAKLLNAMSTVCPPQRRNSTSTNPVWERGSAHHPVNAVCGPANMTTPNHSYGHQARILVVDDVLLNQRVITMKLQQRGYVNVEVASDGQEALDKLRISPFPYHLILMDVSMPGLDGYETTRRIKADSRFASIPVVGVTGNTASQDVARCLSCGMIAVLAKPIDTEKLFEVLREQLMAATPEKHTTASHELGSRQSTDGPRELSPLLCISDLPPEVETASSHIAKTRHSADGARAFRGLETTEASHTSLLAPTASLPVTMASASSGSLLMP